MRLVLFYVSQTMLVVALYNLTYLPTISMDFFEWGNSNTDGLYLLVVPFVLLPTILVASIIKYWVTKKLNIEDKYKWSFLVSIVSVIICTFLVVIDALWPTVVIAFLTMVTIIIETFIVSRQLMSKKLDA